LAGGCRSDIRCRIGAIRVDNKKPGIGPEAEMLARLRVMTEEIRKLQRDFQETLRAERPRRERGTAPDQSKSRKKR